MAEEKKIMRDATMLSVLKYTAFFITLISTAVLLRLLPTASFGIYTALLLVLNYSRFGFLVPYSACYKRIPFLRGSRKGEKKLQEVRDLTFGPTFYIMLILSIIAFISTFFLKQYSAEIIIGIRLLSLLVILQHFLFFYTNFLRIDKKFKIVGILEVVLVGSRLLFFFLLVKSFALTGAMMAFILSFVIAIFAAFFLHRYKFDFSPATINRKAWKLFLFGIPPALVGVVTTIFVTIDKVMIIKFFDSTLLAYYAFAIFILEVISFIPGVVATVIFPRQIEQYGKHLDKSKIKNYLIMPTQIVAYVAPLIIAAAFFFIEFFVNWLFPKYTPALPVVFVLLIAAFFFCGRMSVGNFLIAINKEKNILYAQGILIVFAIVLNIILISLGFGIWGVAIATLCAFILEFIYLGFFALKETSLKFLDSLKLMLGFILPFAYMLLIFYASKWFVYEVQATFMSFLYQCLKYVIFLLLNVPLLYYLNTKTKVFTLFYREFLLKLRILGR